MIRFYDDLRQQLRNRPGRQHRPFERPFCPVDFCGAGATLDGDRAEQLTRFLASQQAAQQAIDSQKAAEDKKFADDLAAEQAAAKEVADDKKSNATSE